MNAIVSPISPATPVAVPPAKGHPFGTDAVYKGYDLMVRKFATHVIRLAQVTTGARADLVRAIGTPAVSFAASAADGSILICCPDGLPDCLNGLAEALETPIPPVGPRLDGIERKLDLLIQDRHSGEHLADRLSALEFALRERLDPEARSVALLAERIETVLLAVTRIPAPAPPDLTPLLAGQRQISDQIAGLPPKDTPLLRLDGRLQDLATRLDRHLPELAQSVSAQSIETGAAIVAQGDRIAALSVQIDQLATRPHPVPDYTAVAATLTDRLHDLTQSLATATDLTQLGASLHAASTEIGTQLATALAMIGRPAQAAEFAAGLAALGQPAQAEQLAAVGATLATISTSLADLGLPAQAGQLDAATDQVAAQLAATAAQIGQPVQAAHLTRATDQIVAELTAARRHDPAPDPALMTTLADLTDQIAAVAQRPDPVIDLTLQHQSFARFGLALGQVVQRLETVAAAAQTGADLSPILIGIESLRTPLTATATAEALSDLADRIEGLARATVPTPEILARLQGFEATLVAALPDDHGLAIADGFAALSAQVANASPAAQLTTLATEVATLQSTLSDQLDALLARPDTSPDIAEQKHHLGAFAAGLADLVQWLDPVTRDLAAGPDFGPILTELDTLRSDLRQDLTLPAQDLQRGLAQISDQIADLIKSPDGVVSLAEQRQGFASFANALDFLMQRVDALAPGGAFAAEPPQGQALSATLSGLVQRLEDALAAGIGKRTLVENAPVAPDPAQLIRNIATATTALATLVTLLEGGQPGLPSTASAPVAHLLDRLERALPGCDFSGCDLSGRDLSGPETRAALADLAQALHGPGQPKDGFLRNLRPDFAELVASALKGQAEA